MNNEYWDKKHKEKYSKEKWAGTPSKFAAFAIDYFPKEGRILELGTGQGGDAMFFDRQGYEVIATDFSDEAIKNAKDRAPAIRFMKMDMAQVFRSWDFDFDIVYSHMALHYFDAETTKKIFEEIHRVLRKDGILALIVNTVDDPEKDLPGYSELEPGFYKSSDGITKRYFSLESVVDFTKDLFEPILVDNKGETYKDETNTLIRFIGKKK